jgi:ABC-type dipeptide/oligopeptide/nickel transport system permease subunit
VQAVQNVDIPIMAAYLMLIAFLFVVINFIVDLLYVSRRPAPRIAGPASSALRLPPCPATDTKAVEATSPISLKARLARRLLPISPGSFRHSPVAMVAAAMTVILLGASLGANWIAPQDAFDPSALNLLGRLHQTRRGRHGIERRYMLGTDNQGRDLFSAILYGSRISLFVGFSSVAFWLVIGITLGLIAGYAGGRTIRLHHAHRRYAADSFPAILIALL